MATSQRHFLDLHVTDAAILKELLDHAAHLKKELKASQPHLVLPGKQLAMIFEKPSTRTRVSFEVGINQLGGQAVIMDAQNTQLGRGETTPDTARVLSRYVDCIMVRCFSHQSLLDLAEYSTVPVINGLTNFSHPCQIMADLLTVQEKKGALAGLTCVWVGDANNVLHSWIHAAVQFGFSLKISCPFIPEMTQEVLDWAAAKQQNPSQIICIDSPEEAASGGDVIITDTWVSMGDDEDDDYITRYQPYQVNSNLMSKAASDAIFMHCLPAHRGEEVMDEVMDGPQSVVWDEAENRLHAQKAVMAWCMQAV